MIKLGKKLIMLKAIEAISEPYFDGSDYILTVYTTHEFTAKFDNLDIAKMKYELISKLMEEIANG